MEVNLDAIDTISSEMDSDFIIIDSEKDETDIAIPYNEGDGKSNTNAETVNELINESDNANGKDLESEETTTVKTIVPSTTEQTTTVVAEKETNEEEEAETTGYFSNWFGTLSDLPESGQQSMSKPATLSMYEY